mmetsp:Transcript_6468/g.19628  ORF Transcript_6468/g.19628 Transcript_6468/m.19628 type:complete len:106 (+) Transcript_6468:280-597(+)
MRRRLGQFQISLDLQQLERSCKRMKETKTNSLLKGDIPRAQTSAVAGHRGSEFGGQRQPAPPSSCGMCYRKRATAEERSRSPGREVLVEPLVRAAYFDVGRPWTR